MSAARSRGESPRSPDEIDVEEREQEGLCLLGLLCWLVERIHLRRWLRSSSGGIERVAPRGWEEPYLEKICWSLSVDTLCETDNMHCLVYIIVHSLHKITGP